MATREDEEKRSGGNTVIWYYQIGNIIGEYHIVTLIKYRTIDFFIQDTCWVTRYQEVHEDDID